MRNLETLKKTVNRIEQQFKQRTQKVIFVYHLIANLSPDGQDHFLITGRDIKMNKTEYEKYCSKEAAN